MEVFIDILLERWNFFTTLTFYIPFDGEVYVITLYGLFLFSTVVVIVGGIIFYALK